MLNCENLDGAEDTTTLEVAITPKEVGDHGVQEFGGNGGPQVSISKRLLISDDCSCGRGPAWEITPAYSDKTKSLDASRA